MAIVAKRRKVQRRGCLMLAGVMVLAILAVPIAFLVADRSGMRYHETPRQVQGLSGVTAVASGSNHSLALKSDGSVWAWGGNTWGELGIGTQKNQSRPQRVLLPRPATAITASSDASFAVTDDGAVWAWGDNRWGVLGTSAILASCYPPRGIRSTGFSTSPMRVENLSGVTTVAAGDMHVLAVTSAGEVWGWGNSTRKQVGPHGTLCAEGYSDQFTRLPAQIEIPGRVTTVAAGYDHSLALLDDGRMWGWGGNDAGQSGFQRGGMTFQVQGISDATAITGEIS
jgi:alpha-tubulin suppressor-like RCC1 family protein